MTFAFPWFLLGGLGAAIPVLIHLYGRRRARRVEFPSLMLLRRAERERSSLVRLRQLWLMLLRALAILLLSLALARPTMTAGGWPWLTGAPVVLVVDDSLSLRARGPARDGFEVARRAAEGLLRSLPGRQTVAVAVLSEGELRVSDREGARRLMEGARASYRAVDVPGAISELWRQTTGELREGRWALFTDLQASAWRSAPEPPPWLAEMLVVDCGADGPNLSVTGLELAEPPALVGRPLRLRVTVQSRPPVPQPLTVLVRVTINRGALPPAQCRVIGGRGEALLEWTPTQPGLLRIAAGIPRDRLAEDNEAYLAVEVRKQLRVLLVGPEPAARWVRLALAPVPGGPVEVRAASGDLTAALPASDAVVLLGQPPRSAREALARYLRAGGGVLAAAAGMAPKDLTAIFGPGAPVLGPQRKPATPVRISGFDGFRPPLQAFANAAAGDLQTPSFRQFRPVSVSRGGPWRVIARFTDQSPALLTATLGTGRAALMAFAPEPTATDLPSQPVFVPLLHRLVGHVARSAPGVMPGAIVGSGTPTESTPERPGFRRLAGPPPALVAANLDPLETDLRRLTPADLRSRLRPVAARVCRPDEAASLLPPGAMSLATPLWALGLALLALELLMLRPKAPR